MTTSPHTLASTLLCVLAGCSSGTDAGYRANAQSPSQSVAPRQDAALSQAAIANGTETSAGLPKQMQATLRKSFDECIEASRGTTVDVLDCIGAEHEHQDARLNSAYRKLHQSLTKADWDALKVQQRKWLQDRDVACREQPDSGTAGTIDANMCFLDRTAMRAQELEDLL